MSQKLLTVKKPIDFDNVMIDKMPLTYERNLIAALIHSHKLFLDTKGSLCPWDAARGTRRPDFAVTHYNVLYEAMAVFYGYFGDTVSKVPIPQSQLEAILIDWNNTGRVATDIIERILAEVREDLYKMELTEEFIEHGVMGKAFRHWISTRLSKRAVEELSSRARSLPMSLEELSGHRGTLPGSPTRYGKQNSGSQRPEWITIGTGRATRPGQ